MESKTEHHWYLPVIFHPSSFELDISYLFRGDGRSPQQIFASGFHARGRDFDLLSHFRPSPGLWSSPDSAYVSTSRSKQVAATFPKNVKNNGFLYLIKPQEQGIDLEKTFGKLEKKVPNAWLLKLEQEIAIPGGIQQQDIKGAWRIKEGMLTDEFIANPAYQEVGIHRVAKGIRVAGHAATGVAMAMDGMALFRAYEQGQTSGGFDKFFNETTRVIYAWISAYGLGRIASEAASAACASLGPAVKLGCGVAAGLAGSFFGYRAGEKMAQQGWVSPAAGASLKDPEVSMDEKLAPVDLDESLDEYVTNIQNAFSEDGEVQDAAKTYLASPEKPKAFVAFQQEVVSHFQQEKTLDEFKTFAFASSSFCFELAQLTHSKVAMNAAVGIRSVHDACVGIHTLAKTAAGMTSLAEFSLSNLSGFLQGGSLVLGAFNLFSNLIDDDPEPDNGLAIALSAIQTAIYQMWEDTRTRFEITWKMLEKIQASLDEMEKRQAKRFLQTLRAIDYYGAQTITKLSALETGLHRHIDHSEYRLGTYLHALADERTLDTIRAIHKSKEHALASFIDYGSTLVRWLTVTAAIPGRSGWMSGRAVELKTLLPRLEEAFAAISSHEPPLGLLAKLALQQDPSLVSPEQVIKLIHPQDWSKVLASYLYLMMQALGGIKQEQYGPAHIYYDEIESIREMAEIVIQFHSNCQASSLLWQGLVQDYRQTVIGFQMMFKEIVQEENQAMNAAYELNPREKLLSLDEIPQESYRRMAMFAKPLMMRLTQELSPKTLLLRTPIPGEQRRDYTKDYMSWIHNWEDEVPVEPMVGGAIAYLDERQVDTLLAQASCRMILEKLTTSPEFQLAYLYQQAKLHIQCEALKVHDRFANYSIAIGLQLNDEIRPIYQWVGVSMPSTPGGRGQYVGYGNLLPRLEAWAVARFNDCYKGPHYGPTSPWNELHFHSEQVNADFDLERTKHDMSLLLQHNILQPRREQVFSKMAARMNFDDLDRSRLQLFALLKMVNPGFDAAPKLLAKHAIKKYFLMKDANSLAQLCADNLWQQLLAMDLQHHRYAAVADISTLVASWLNPIVHQLPVEELPLVQEMRKAEFELTRLANELSPLRISAQQEFLAHQHLKRWTQCRARITTILSKADVLLSQDEYVANFGEYASSEDTGARMSALQWEMLKESSFSPKSLFPLLLDWYFTPEHRPLLLQRFLQKSTEEDFSSLLQEQDAKTGLFPLHLAASLGEMALVKPCLTVDDIPDCPYGPPMIQGLLAIYTRWQAESRKLGFSLIKTVSLMQQAQQSIAELRLHAPAWIFLGPTGAGKSSLINACLGVNYTAAEDEYGDLILLATEQKEPAYTSHSSVSATLFPAAYPSLDGSEVYIDMPGEADTRGKPEQICAGMISQRIYQECTAIKGVVMVLPKDAFSGRYEALQSLLMKVSAIFVEMSDEEMMQHLKLVVTKTQGMEKRQIMLKLQKIYDEPKSCGMVKRMLAGLIRNPMKVILVDVDNLEMLAKLQLEFAHTEALSAHRFAFASDSDPLVIFKQILTFMQSEEEKLRLDLLSHQQLFAQMLHQEILVLSKELLSLHKTEEGEKFQALLLQFTRLIAPWVREDVTMQVKDLSRFYDTTKDLLMRAQLHQEFLSTMTLMEAKPEVRRGMPIEM